MNLCKVQSDVVIIPFLPHVTLHNLATDPPFSNVVMQRRTVHLHYREFEDRMIAVAYDRETDTLFVKDE